MKSTHRHVLHQVLRDCRWALQPGLQPHLVVKNFGMLYLAKMSLVQARYVSDLCSERLSADTLRALGGGALASQDVLREISAREMRPVTDNMIDTLERMCEENQRDCVPKARIILEKVFSCLRTTKF